MDYDNDGVQDFISGSYDPGDVYLFKGLGDGKYAKVESILDENDLPLVHHPVELAKYLEYQESKNDDSKRDDEHATQNRVASFGSWAAPVDWDDDGDLDILIGSFAGNLFLRKNMGTRSEPVYSGESDQIDAGGEPLKVTCHTNPVIADWNNDGLWDLVVGCGDGSVGWHKNTGSPSNPIFGPRHLLVAPAAEMKFLQQSLAEGEDPVPGVRSQICVTDYDRDGMLDLIVGDYSDINWTRKLTDQEIKELEMLVESQKEISANIQELQQAIYGDDSEDLDETAKAEKQKQYSEIVSQYQELEEEKKGFYKESRRASFIWLYTRKRIVSDQTFVNQGTN